MMKAEAISREFKYGSVVLPDPDPAMTAEQVKNHYSTAYPELTTATVGGEKYSGSKRVVEFKANLGTKG
jgi:PRTRC genetic system protein C